MRANVICVSDYVKDSLSIVESAELVARAVIDRLAAQGVITVSLKDVRGPSSSFFNVLLQSVAERFGLEAVTSRLQFEFDSGAQKALFQRSRESFLRAAR